MADEREEAVRRLLVGIFADCIDGLADAAIIRDQVFTVEHVAGAMKQLADYAKSLRVRCDELERQLAPASPPAEG